MTEQRKRTLPIRETLSLLDSMIRGGENHSELSKRKLEESRSILDKLEDPWFYVEDGELPEFVGHARNKNAPFHSSSDYVLIKLKDDVEIEDPFVGFYQWQKDKGYFFITGDGMPQKTFRIDSVKCWQYIE